MPVRENPLSSIPLFIPQIFQDVQKTVSNHRKNAVVLRKFQAQCSNYNKANHSDNFGENEFNKEFVKNVNKILPVKKGQANVERVIAFIATFVNYCHEKGILGKIIYLDNLLINYI
jgi:condensin complex subunit 3